MVTVVPPVAGPLDGLRPETLTLEPPPVGGGGGGGGGGGAPAQVRVMTIPVAGGGTLNGGVVTVVQPGAVACTS